jgi:hypothetical protein
VGGTPDAGVVGPSNGTGTVNGTVGGRTMIVADAVASPYHDALGLVFGTEIAITEWAGACSKSFRANAAIVRIVLHDFDGTFLTPPAGPGTYPVFVNGGGGTAPRRADFLIVLNGASCSGGVGGSGNLGSVTLTKVQGGSVAGSFDVTLTNQQQISGTFDSTACAIETPQPGCQ